MILATLLIVIAYLMGSICSAIIVCKAFSLPDPRTKGSKNPGATNVLRIAGKEYAIMVLVGDILKGLIPVLIAKIFVYDPMFIGFIVLATVLGHIFPVFFDFKGGKGVATAIGALLGFQFMIGILVALTWLIVAKISRYSSLASIVSICLAPLYSLFLIGNIEVFPPLFFLALLILYTHKANIGRLIDGTESKIKLKDKDGVLEEILEEQPKPEKPVAPKPKTVRKPKTGVTTETKAKTVKKPAAKKPSTTKEKKPAKPKAEKSKEK